jgi:hypothetical protein
VGTGTAETRKITSRKQGDEMNYYLSDFRYIAHKAHSYRYVLDSQEKNFIQHYEDVLNELTKDLMNALNYCHEKFGAFYGDRFYNRAFNFGTRKFSEVKP